MVGRAAPPPGEPRPDPQTLWIWYLPGQKALGRCDEIQDPGVGTLPVVFSWAHCKTTRVLVRDKRGQEQQRTGDVGSRGQSDAATSMEYKWPLLLKQAEGTVPFEPHETHFGLVTSGTVR